MTLKIVAAATIFLFASGCSARSERAKAPDVEPGAIDFKSVDPPRTQIGADATTTGEATLD
ncbi:MAG: hypothetical protein U0S50_05965 [Sphingopyxis sp.]|uniref:hypothetical protein n=1 Tax=Sphingopyxis sp. TaxID=1908224 RepID=UPI002AB805B2|nr:hypothetical protein [Sphingopyxis sp.]MDZ3831349.1 hypothetical protein [Sphingopyxis sp.]